MSGLNLILEVGTEEIPAGYLGPALDALKERVGKGLSDHSLACDHITVWGTPRRIALAIEGLEEKQPDTVKEVTGPPIQAAYDSSGRPTKAAEGFARGQGLQLDQLHTVDTKKGKYLAAKIEVKGRPAADVLVEMLPQIISGLPFPKTMRWGRGEHVFVRPVHWLLAVLNGRVLPMSFGGMRAGKTSRGHRFHHPKEIEIQSPDEYPGKLLEAGVVVGFDKRVALVREEIDKVIESAREALVLIPDEELIEEVANLVEIPVATLGEFDRSFLELPAEVPITAMREHQRYFALTYDDGGLAPYFIAINNTRAKDLDVVRRGHERVLRARLEDAGFYFKEDTKTPLEAKQEELKKVVFHTLLGTSWEKVERFSRLAGYLADRLASQVNDDSVKAHLLRAAGLCKCDLVTGVVGEFPALQGIMGSKYALKDGEPPEVAQAIAEHYWPTRAGGDLPETQVGALLSMADKMDTICGCFGVGLIPTGAADPFALRRQSLGIMNIILDRGYRLDLPEFIDQALEGLTPWLTRPAREVKADVLEFFRLRLKNQLTGQNASTDVAEAVLSLHCEDIVPAVAKIWALEQVKARPDFEDLAEAFKRVVNIIRKFGAQDEFNEQGLVVQQERDLAEATAKVEKRIVSFVEAEDYTELLSAIVGLKPAVDSFFDNVLVDDPDPAVKKNRLALLTRVSQLFETVADFSKLSA